MNTGEAVRTLQKHNAEFKDEADTLLNCLRPYSGIKKAHFWEIIEALYFAAPLLNTEKVDRDLVHTIWDMTRCARMWTRGPHEPMFHGREFISDADQQTLDRWVNKIESITLYLLRGFAAWEAISCVTEEIDHETLVDLNWLVAPSVKLLEYHLSIEMDAGFGDDLEILCQGLAKIGAPALTAIPTLQRVASTSKFPSAKSAAESAITILTNHSK